MKVVAFVGPSGTGKSHRAIGIAHKNNCDAIIDDGLLIKGTKILAGTSAKNETNRIQAVKRAIFTEEDHAEAVRQALAGNDVRRLLILATSDNVFESPSGKGVYLSVLLRPAVPAASAQTATIGAAVAVCRAVQELCGLELGIKWVNDLYYQGKKVCGILTEAGTDLESGRLEWLVVPRWNT